MSEAPAPADSAAAPLRRRASRSPSASRRSCCWWTRRRSRSPTSPIRCLQRSTAAARADRPRGLPARSSRCAPDPCGSVGEAIVRARGGPAAAAGRRRDADGRRPPSRRRSCSTSSWSSRSATSAWSGRCSGLIKRTPECALHVHVGLPDTDAAVAAMNGLRELLPLLHGLGANSPVLVRRRLRHGELAGGGDPRLPGPRHPAGARLVGRLPGRPRRGQRWRRAHGPHDGLVGRAASAAARHGRAARGGRAVGPRVGRCARRARARDRAARRGGTAQVNCAGAGAALVELPGRARRARRRDLLRRRPAAAARGGRTRAGASWRAPTPSSRASSESSARATARTGSAPRMSAAACRACSVTSRT